MRACIIILALLMGTVNAENPPMVLSEIVEPVVVGKPPSNAFVGLVRLDTGEIRHYNYSTVNPAYLSSTDNGLNWTTKKTPPYTGADVKSPISGEYVRLATHENAVYCIRSKGGIDGEWTFKKVWPERFIMLKPPVFIRNGKRILVGAHNTKGEGCNTFYSDDDGLTWNLSNFVVAPHHQTGGLHNGLRWNHGAVEPTVVELKDGRVWMIMRTAQDNHYESFSEDGGETWSEAVPSRFYGTITMPTITRLRDGRILFLWNNTTALPEVNNPDGVWEDIFTNRDALHAAISEDEGETWIGFRELFLNEDRNRDDFATWAKDDMSVHQTQVVELPEGKILVSLGQGISRRLLIFDPKWLYETERTEDFTNGCATLTTHQYLSGIKGHCAYNRIAGASMVNNPELARSVLKICNPEDDRLVLTNQGAVWNFPNTTSGHLTIKIQFPKGSKGGRIALLDRWVNAVDRWSDHYAMYTLNVTEALKIGKTALLPDQWHLLRFEWQHDDRCTLYLDGVKLEQTLPLKRNTKNGLSYVHLIAADEKNSQGMLVADLAAAH